MVYTHLTALAMRIACEAHNNQLDKGGFLYIHHPLFIAQQLHTENDVVVALLHDVIEDTDMTIDDLKNLGIPQECLDAIDLLSRKEDDVYIEYIQSLRHNKMACRVKRLDLLHNLDFRRLLQDEKQESRLKRYSKALVMIESYLAEQY